MTIASVIAIAATSLLIGALGAGLALMCIYTIRHISVLRRMHDVYHDKLTLLQQRVKRAEDQRVRDNNQYWEVRELVIRLRQEIRERTSTSIEDDDDRAQQSVPVAQQSAESLEPDVAPSVWQRMRINEEP